MKINITYEIIIYIIFIYIYLYQYKMDQVIIIFHPFYIGTKNKSRVSYQCE
jgi:hypothetical protein